MRTRKYQIVVDDTAPVPESLKSIIGMDHFGSVQFRQQSLFDALSGASRDAGLGAPLHLRTEADAADLVQTLSDTEDPDQLFLLCPANIVAACPREELVIFLRQIAFAQDYIFIHEAGPRGGSGWALLPGSTLRRLLRAGADGERQRLHDEIRDTFVDIRGRLNLIDIAEERTLLDFLSGQLDARHFNQLQRDEYTVTKRSKDVEKLKREFEFYGHTPPEMQMFLVQPFDFRVEGDTASYRMERLFMPDMALQMVHGALKPAEFDRFLSHIFHFFSIRPQRKASAKDEDLAIQRLYVDKVLERIAELKSLPAYGALEPFIVRACGGIDALVERYLAQLEKAKRRLRCGVLVLGHGDPCFSNILYSRTNQLLKLIDARGAKTADELYTHAYYDIAKLSHSVLGGYDSINQAIYTVTLDHELNPQVSLQARLGEPLQERFISRLEQAGFDYHLTRLCEASLFISMTPMHIDRPLKVLAFIVTAQRILDELDNSEAKRGQR